MTPLKAITLWEPFASSMAIGAKHNETRSWPTSHRGDLAICAAKRKMDPLASWLFSNLIRPLIPECPNYQPKYGICVCIVEVFDCVATDGGKGINDLEYHLGNYNIGRFAWKTRNCRMLANPVLVTGRQRLFFLPPAVTERVLSDVYL